LAGHNFPSEMLILFIDDDDDDSELFCDAMKAIKPDAKCIFQTDGAAALKYLRRSVQLPDYIFLDIHMPVMGGVECLKKIKADENLKDIPVIVYTSETDPKWSDTNLRKYRDLGAVRFMTKPSTFQEIVKMLKAFFGESIL